MDEILDEFTKLIEENKDCPAFQRLLTFALMDSFGRCYMRAVRNVFVELEQKGSDH